LRHSIIILSLLTLLLTFSSETFGQIKKAPYVSLVRIGDSTNYDVDPKGKYHLIITALNRFLLIDSLIKNEDTIIVCLDRYNIFADEIKEVLVPSKLPPYFGSYKINYLNREAIVKLSEETKKPIRFALIREIIDYHFAARISLTSKLQLPRRIKNFSDKEYFVLYEYLFNNKEFHYLPEESEEGWELITR
jgi:hypothetical protein